MKKLLILISVQCALSCWYIRESKITGLIILIKDADGAVQKLVLNKDHQVEGKMSLIYAVSKDWDRSPETQRWSISEQPYAIEISGKFRSRAHLRRKAIIFEVVDSVKDNPYRFRYYYLAEALDDYFPELRPEEFFSPNQVEYFRKVESIFYIGPKEGSSFSFGKDAFGQPLKKMSYADKFIALRDAKNEFQSVTINSERWLKGYWRCNLGFTPASKLIPRFPERYASSKGSANTELEWGYLADLGSPIYELPDEKSRIVATSSTSFPGILFTLAYGQISDASPWVFVEVGALGEPIRDKPPELLSGCVRRNRLGTVKDLKPVTDFPPGTYAGGFGETGLTFHCAKGGLCSVSTSDFYGHTQPTSSGPYQIVRNRDFYGLLLADRAIYPFFIISGQIHGWSEIPMGLPSTFQP